MTTSEVNVQYTSTLQTFQQDFINLNKTFSAIQETINIKRILN